MGRRGPGKTPTQLKILSGSKRVNRQAPIPRPGHIVCPRDMTKEAQGVWRHVLREMSATGILRPVHTDVLRAYCEAVARYREAARLIAVQGPTVEGRNGDLVKNPLHQIVRDNARLMRDFAREMGLTPSSAEGIHAIGGEGGSEDAASAWLGKYSSS